MTFYFRRRRWETSSYFWSIVKVINFQVSDEWKAKQKYSFSRHGEECFHVPREPQGLLIMMQLTVDFQAWKCLGVFTNSKRQSLECNKTKRYNQSKLVFTELVDVYGFIGGRKSKIEVQFLDCSILQMCRLIHRACLWASEIPLGVLEMWFRHRSLCKAKMVIKKIRVLRERQMVK